MMVIKMTPQNLILRQQKNLIQKKKKRSRMFQKAPKVVRNHQNLANLNRNKNQTMNHLKKRSSPRRRWCPQKNLRQKRKLIKIEILKQLLQLRNQRLTPNRKRRLSPKVRMKMKKMNLILMIKRRNLAQKPLLLRVRNLLNLIRKKHQSLPRLLLRDQRDKEARKMLKRKINHKNQKNL